MTHSSRRYILYRSQTCIRGELRFTIYALVLWFVTEIGNELLDHSDFALDAFPTFSYFSHLALNFVFCKVDARFDYGVVAH